MGDSKAMRVLLVGASGLVGQGVMQACLESQHVAQVVALVRRPGSLPADVDAIVLPDFLQCTALGEALSGFDACFYCAGAPPVGTPEAEYRRVTLQVTQAVAEAWSAANPGGFFLYVSGAQANPRSRIMPLRVKGEIEQALAQLPLRAVMLRPAGVRPVAGTGTRHVVLKPFYLLARPLMAMAEVLLPMLTTSNRAIGQAMIALARMPAPPAVVECAEINRLARASSAR
ncbi:NAD(P)H-binding protein [Stenotrophomonas sp.]|uniref:NAD(P)H-binding protein n=1 Tax=Stenotrophomonas sp. TaxID=69392 RepID=UPI002D2B46E4|nr:NAD(P)H-binding protein [Stenotrophomonas sp.]HYQ21959.1 NAD(P)H-binding protein [Stenotrophomonas sp.]